MNRTLHKAFAPVLLTLGLFSAAAIAQSSAPAPTPAPAPAPAPAAGKGEPSGAAPSRAEEAAPSHAERAAARHARKHQDRVEERISQLHSQLKITSEQAKQWEAFAQAMRENARRIDQAIQDRAKKLASMSADDVMKSYAALAQVHAENLRKLSDAFSGLYGVLSDAQKQTADVLFRNQHARKPAKHHSRHESHHESHHKSHRESSHHESQHEAAPAASVPAAE